MFPPYFLPNHHLPLSAFLPYALYLLNNSPTSFLCLKVANQFAILLPNWVLGSLLLGKFDLKSSLPSKKTLVDALLSLPPRTNIIWFNLSALGRLILLPNSDGSSYP